MRQVSTLAEIKSLLSEITSEGKSVGLVPTMGALHQGHISLVERATRENDVAICNIFVNPAQFNNKSDLKHYPRQLSDDLTKLEKAGCHIVFTPKEEEIYPASFESNWKSPDLGIAGKVMEGKYRPGHFNGVVKVITRLFQIFQPTRAYFGLKDYQQYYLIDQLTKNSFPKVSVVGCDTVREKDGLAMSSRNLRLSEEERKNAGALYQALKKVQNELSLGNNPQRIQKIVMSELENIAGVDVEYFEIRDESSFEAPGDSLRKGHKYRAFVSAHVGPVRLIDNLLVFP